jgi:hypothetical protein
MLMRPWTVAGTIAVLIIAGAAMTGSVTSAVAADLRAEAHVNRTALGVGDHLVLTISVSGGEDVQEPDLSSIVAFRIASTSRSHSINVVNFKMTRSLNLQYVLVALKEGDHVLGPFTIRAKNETYETEPIRVSVARGQPSQRGQAPGQGQQATADPVDQDLALVRVYVDRKQAYVGQQITHTVKFAFRVRLLEGPHFMPRDHTGFWFEDLGISDAEIETIGGVQYYVVSARTAYFPITSGTHRIGPSSVRFRMRELETRSRDPFDLFRRDPFGVFGGVDREAAAGPVDIEVLPLPTQGRPEDFSGAVGTFNLTVVPSSRELTTGESLTLSVRIRGRGNIKSIGDIEMPEFEGFRVFAPKARESMNVQNLLVGGEKTFDLVLVPQRPGRHTLEGFRLSYFDPESAAYMTVTGNPVEVVVEPGDEDTIVEGTGEAPETGATRRDIRHIRRTGVSRNELALGRSDAAGLLMRYAPIVIAIAGLVVSLQRRRAAVTGKGAQKRAFKDLMKDLNSAKGLVGREAKTGAACGVAAKALRSYLGVRLGVSETEVSEPAIASATNMPGELRDSVTEVLSDLDRIRFAPVNAAPGDVAKLIDKARDLMKSVSSEWKD